jgi:hypothetical protein
VRREMQRFDQSTAPGGGGGEPAGGVMRRKMMGLLGQAPFGSVWAFGYDSACIAPNKNGACGLLEFTKILYRGIYQLLVIL